MILPETLKKVAAALDRAGVEYMLSGSFASSYYGLPRSSQDVDLVIHATRDQLVEFLESLPTGKYYADSEAAISAFEHQSMFNLIDLGTGRKVDLIIRKARPFSQEEFRGVRELRPRGLIFAWRARRT